LFNKNVDGMYVALIPKQERMLYVDTNNNTNNNKQKVKDQNINKETEADLIVDRKVCERNDYDISAGDFVVVQYPENRYCGQVIDINNNDNTVLVNLMKECENVQHKFKWPTSDDIDWVDFDEIVKKSMFLSPQVKPDECLLSQKMTSTY